MNVRRQFIVDMVEKYKTDYPEEYAAFKELMQWRKDQMKDRKIGAIQGTTEMRNAASLPDKLMNLLLYVLDGVTEPKFLEPKGEMKWFLKKYPEFLLPMSY